MHAGTDRSDFQICSVFLFKAITVQLKQPVLSFETETRKEKNNQSSAKNKF